MDWATTIQARDIDTITRLIESGVMQWKNTAGEPGDTDEDGER